MRMGLRCSCAFAILLAASFALAQSEFSADIVNHNEKTNRGVTRVYFGKDKVRFNSAQGGDQGAVIFDFAKQSYIVLMPRQHMYMDMPTQAMESRGVFSFFKTGDVENACSDWLNLAANKGGSCHKVGSETVNGRHTVKYEGTNAKGESATVWLDSDVRFPIKWEGNHGSGELQNIQVGAQPSSLFEPPAGYTRMQLPNGMQMPGMQSH
jgi:hypothetical protein